MPWVRILSRPTRNIPQKHYPCTSQLLDTNHLINIRFLGSKEFRCYLNSKTFQVKKEVYSHSYLISNPSEKYLEVKQVGNMWVLRWNFLLLLVQTANSIFVINLTLDRHEKIYISHLCRRLYKIIGDRLLLYFKLIIFFMSCTNIFLIR